MLLRAFLTAKAEKEKEGEEDWGKGGYAAFSILQS